MAKKQFKAESRRLLDLMINSIYTHQEIFLREIISNASDAMDKLAYRALTDDKVSLDRESLAITITREKDKGVLTVSDKGIGMTKEELEENLGTIAKSGSLGFKQEMEQTEGVDIIGQFGVGFYAAFMVAEQVTVISKKYGQDQAWMWTSDGADGYTIREASREDVGTDVIMTLKKDTEEEKYSRFLEEYEIRQLVKKYSDYIRYPIRMEVTTSRLKEGCPEDKPEYESCTQVQTLNSMVPLWQRAKKDVTEEEYTAFYREKFFDFQKPARVIHASTEGAVSYKALLYIPGKAPYDFNTAEYKRGLQLYSSGVMIMDCCEDLIGEHFRFVRGVVDSQDLSLNISREMLQHNRQLTVIGKNIEKKIKSELTSMMANEREQYEALYAQFGRQLKYGVVAEYGAHKDVTRDLLLFHSNKEQKLVSLAAYVEAMAQDQEKIYYIPAQSLERARKLPQVATLEKKGYDVLLLTDEIDEFVMQTLGAYEEKPLCNAATDDLGLQSEEEKKTAEEKNQELKGILTFLQQTLGQQIKEARVSAGLGEYPVALVSGTGMSFEMEKYMKRMNPDFPIPAEHILQINPEHPAVQAMIAAVTEDVHKAEDYARLLYGQAQLMADLPLEDPVAYTELVCKLMR